MGWRGNGVEGGGLESVMVLWVENASHVMAAGAAQTVI